MSKIIAITEKIVSIGMDDGSIKEVRLSDCNFIPELNDEVEIFTTETNTIVHKLHKLVPTTKHDGINISINNENQTQSPSGYVASGKVVSKTVYLLLTFFLGGFGIHKFYAGKIGTGVIFLLFSFTGIPVIIALIEFFIACFKPSDINGNIIV